MDNQSYIQKILEEYNSLQQIAGFVEANRTLTNNDISQKFSQDIQFPIADPERLISIAFRIEQIAIRLLGQPNSIEYRTQSKSAFEQSAKIFEQILETQAINSKDVNLELYLHSAIDYSLGEFQANAAVIARKVLETYDFDKSTHSLVLQSTFLLLQGKFFDLDRIAENIVNNKAAYEENIQRQIQLKELDELGATEEVANFLAIEAILSFSKYLRFGQNENYNIAVNKIQVSLDLFSTIRDPENYVISQLVGLLFRQMQFSSLWNQLGDIHSFRKNPILDRYIRILTTDKGKPVYELWDSQITALPKILQNKSSTVLQMPTSAGKTRIAELKIIQTLATSGSGARCIYVAPFKSLVAQIEESLSRYLVRVGYRVTSVIGSYESDEFEDLIIDQSDILVLTPEKLDYLFRQNKDFFSKVNLIVFDEGHIIDNNERGIRVEFLIQRIKKFLQEKNLQILFVSAVAPNSDEIAGWLENGNPNTIASQWKPTRLRQGIFYWNNNSKGVIRYPIENILIETNLKQKLLQSHKKNKPKERLKKAKFSYKSSNDIAVELSLVFRNASPTIVFTSVRRDINSIVKQLYKKILDRKKDDPTFTFVANSKQIELDDLATIIENRMGKDFPLAKYVREGIGYHHALLPDDIKSLIETAFRNESIRCLIATTTLAQGVNLPVRLMIIANLRLNKDTIFSVRDFRNIVGRAGRAMYETEGLVILVQNLREDLLDKKVFSFLRDDKTEKVNSALFRLYEDLIKRKLGISLKAFIENLATFSIEGADIQPSTELDVAFQSQILAMLYEGLLEDNNAGTVQKVIDDSLFGYQWKGERIFYSPLIELGEKYVRFLSGQFKSQKQKNAYYRTGFSIKSCLELDEGVRKALQAGAFKDIRDHTDNSLDKKKLTQIFELIKIPRETYQSKHSDDIEVINAMIDWINFGEISNLMDTYASKNKLFRDPLEVSNLISRYFMNNAPWALNGLSKILDYIRDTENIQVHSEIGLLSSYVKYGVNTPVAAYLCGMGVVNRESARLISEHYYDEVSPANLIPSQSDFREWLQDLTFEDLRSVLNNDRLVYETWSVIKKVKLDIRPIDVLVQPQNKEILTYVVGLKHEKRTLYIKDLAIGTKLTLIREPDNLFDPYALAVYTSSGNKLGYIRSSRAFIYSSLIEQGVSVECSVEKISSPTSLPNRRLLVKLKT